MAFARPILPFLRPLATPKPASIGQLLRFSQSYRKEVTTASTKTVASPSPEAAARKLPYRIDRTPSAQLPVYQTAKAGGNLKETKLRKIVGDLNALREDLRTYLGVPDEHVRINQLTRHVIVKGHKKLQLQQFCQEHKF